MLKDQVRAILARQPFVPFRIHLADGKRYDVDHPEVFRDLGYSLLVFIGHKLGTHSADGYDRFPFEDIVRIQDLKSRGGPRRRKAS